MEDKTNGSVDTKRYYLQLVEDIVYLFENMLKPLLQLSVYVHSCECVYCDSPVENGQLLDPANWGVADVVNYFKATGFEEQATAFQDQVELLFTFRFPVT